MPLLLCRIAELRLGRQIFPPDKKVGLFIKIALEARLFNKLPELLTHEQRRRYDAGRHTGKMLEG